MDLKENFDWKPVVKKDLRSYDRMIYWQKRVAIVMLGSLAATVLAMAICDDLPYRHFPDQYLHLVLSTFLLLFHFVDTYHSRSSLRQIIYALSDLDKMSLGYANSHPKEMERLKARLHWALMGLRCPYVFRTLISITTFSLLIYTMTVKPYQTRALFTLEMAGYVSPVISVFWNSGVLYYAPKHSCLNILPGSCDAKVMQTALLTGIIKQ